MWCCCCCCCCGCFVLWPIDLNALDLLYGPDTINQFQFGLFSFITQLLYIKSKSKEKKKQRRAGYCRLDNRLNKVWSERIFIVSNKHTKETHCRICQNCSNVFHSMAKSRHLVLTCLFLYTLTIRFCSLKLLSHKKNCHFRCVDFFLLALYLRFLLLLVVLQSQHKRICFPSVSSIFWWDKNSMQNALLLTLITSSWFYGNGWNNNNNSHHSLLQIYCVKKNRFFVVLFSTQRYSVQLFFVFWWKLFCLAVTLHVYEWNWVCACGWLWVCECLCQCLCFIKIATVVRTATLSIVDVPHFSKPSIPNQCNLTHSKWNVCVEFFFF